MKIPILSNNSVLLFVIFSVTIFAFVFTIDADSKISNENITNAGKIIGLEFSESEKDSMAGDLITQLGNYNSIRSLELPNSVPPAIQFNPIPVGFKFNKTKDEINFSDYSNTLLPTNIDDLAFYTIGELAYLIESKQISSLKLTTFFLDRLKKYGPKLECVISLTEERALKQAANADKEISQGIYKGKLHGIPFGIKDLLSTKNYKTTWGAVPYKDQILDEDAAVVKKLEEAGGVMVAKLTLGALAWGDVWYGGKTRNPWNIEQGSSGSSAGSASATSAGLVPFAIGTETWGSIVSPSTVCGTTGLRPTYGRVSRTGAMALSWTMDKIGPICRSTEDLAIVFDVIQGVDGIDQTLYDLPFNYSSKVDFKKLKIGYIKNDFESEYESKSYDEQTLAKLRDLGAELIPIELPKTPIFDLAFILSAEAGAAFDKLTRENMDDLMVRQIRDAWPNVFRASRFIPAVEYINANRIRYQLIQEMAEVMKKVDVYLSPSFGPNLLLTNLTGHPCVVLPNGFTEDGTPTSITFMGNLFEEGKLIAVSKAYQDATDFHKKHPNLDF